MNSVFADSYYFFALLAEDDLGHDKAVEFTRSFTGKIVTTGWILTELADGLAAPNSRSAFLRTNDTLRANPNVEIVPFSDPLFETGVDLYRQRPDKGWSLTDCISFVVMQRHGLSEALTADRHFEQDPASPLK